MRRLSLLTFFTFSTFLSFLFHPQPVWAQLSRVEINARETLAESGVRYSYDKVEGILHFVLDPTDPANRAIVDIEYAPVNEEGMVEYSADFRMLIPSADIANGTLVYHVNNRGRSLTHPEISLQHPVAGEGFTYLVTGWINELSSGSGRLRLHAPIVSTEQAPLIGDVRYELSTGRAADSIKIGGGGHLAYAPTQQGLQTASLTRRLYQADPKTPIERSQFDLSVTEVADSNQVDVSLSLAAGFEPGYLYELIYEARDPVLAGAGMSAIRDMVSAIRYGTDAQGMTELELPAISHAITYGVSQSGRLLRQFIYDGFNADLDGRSVFEGAIPIIAGGGYGMFNMRFAMPTRTNGHHSNYLYPNDLFPFTYGNSTDPYTGRQDGVLTRARLAGVEPKLMHIQTSNEYWLRAGSLPHTTPDGRADAVIPDNVRFYTIGGSQHGSGNGRPRAASSGQLPPNPSMWMPISDSLLVAMNDWVVKEELPPPSRYPRIADGSLVVSHQGGDINPAAWNQLNGINYPESMYAPGLNDYGNRWLGERIVDRHPSESQAIYRTLVPQVDSDNNDLATATILPPTAQVPLATFMTWNLRAPATGAEKSLARLAGGYIPFAGTTAQARAAGDSRSSIEGLYGDFDDYLAKYEAATDALIAEGFLLPGFKAAYMEIAQENESLFP